MGPTPRSQPRVLRDSRPFLVASRGNLESRRTQGGGFRRAPCGSLPHILSDCPASGYEAPRGRVLVSIKADSGSVAPLGGPSAHVPPTSVERMVRPAFPQVGTPGPPPGLRNDTKMRRSILRLQFLPARGPLDLIAPREKTFAATRRKPRSAYAQAQNEFLGSFSSSSAL